MADLKVEVIKIDDIKDHPNADRMELAVVGGYQVCVQLGTFISGDLAVYVPVDSVVPEKLEAYIFGPDSKVKLHKHRVRAIRLRGAMSEGMLLPTDMVFDYFNSQRKVYRIGIGDDLTDALGIKKYTPPAAKVPGMMNVSKPKRHHHPDFKKYTQIQHIKRYNDSFEEGETVYVTEKIHGTNFRAGWVPFKPRTFLSKLKNIFGLNPKWEFVYGSHNIQLMDGLGKRAFNENVYKRCVTKYDLKNKIGKGEVWYAEIFGPGIQKGYGYGLSDYLGKTEFGVRFMDIWYGPFQKYLNFGTVVHIVEGEGLQVVPYQRMLWDRDKIEHMLNADDATSELDPATFPIEGFVVRPFIEDSFYGGRRILKWINDEYSLNKDNTDWK